MNSLIQFFVFDFKAIVYRNKQMPKKQLEYLECSQYWGGGGRQSLVLTGLLGGMRDHISKLLGGAGPYCPPHPVPTPMSSRKLLRIKVTPDLHLIYSKNGGNLGLVLKMKNIAFLSILLTKHVKYTYFIFV